MLPSKDTDRRQEEFGVTEGARRASGVTPIGAGLNPPDPEVPEKKPRRKFTAAYKLRVLKEAEACTEPGEIGALLRREGLYSSNLSSWRRQCDQGRFKGLSPKKRGRKPRAKNPLTEKIAQLDRENRLLRKKLKQAETIIEVQKKISDLLGATQPETGNGGNDS
jgi:transposase-like protein